MNVDCHWCGEKVEDIVDYDEFPFHRDCLKEKYREDNPGVSDKKKEKFDNAVEEADRLVISGNVIIPVIHEEDEKGERKNG